MALIPSNLKIPILAGHFHTSQKVEQETLPDEIKQETRPRFHYKVCLFSIHEKLIKTRLESDTQTLWKQKIKSVLQAESAELHLIVTQSIVSFSSAVVSLIRSKLRPRTWNITTRFVICESPLARPTFDHRTDPETDTAKKFSLSCQRDKVQNAHQKLLWVNVLEERRVAAGTKCTINRRPACLRLGRVHTKIPGF